MRDPPLRDDATQRINYANLVMFPSPIDSNERPLRRRFAYRRP